MPGKLPSREEQEVFRDILQGYIEQALNSEIELYFFDPCHCVHNNHNGYQWQKKGKTGTKQIKANSGRDRVNVIGAINAITLKPYVYVTEANCDQEMICLYLEGLRQQCKGNQKIVMVLDNAPYNHAYTVKDKAKILNIELVYLPPYCPNLNLIERLWKFLKKQVKTNNYCAKFDDFFDRIVSFFEDINQHKEKLKSLLTLNFEIIQAE